jgi:hypothetical protein
VGTMRWLHCGHCGQTLLTDNLDKCDACGKLGPMMDPTSAAALKDLMSRKMASGQRGRFKPVILAAIVLLLLIVSAPIVGVACDKALAFDMATAVLGIPPGVGDVERANRKIKNGMSKDEVRSMLGIPHVDGGNEWRYWEDRLASSILRVQFGPDDRVTSSEWWGQ